MPAPSDLAAKLRTIWCKTPSNARGQSSSFGNLIPTFVRGYSGSCHYQFRARGLFVQGDHDGIELPFIKPAQQVSVGTERQVNVQLRAAGLEPHQQLWNGAHGQ